MRRLDGYLSRKAQARLTGSALVWIEEDDSYTLQRAGVAPISLGPNFSSARSALGALATAQHAELMPPPQRPPDGAQ